MIIRTFVAVVAIVAVPVTVVGAEPAPRKSESAEKKVCSTDTTIGTRLGSTRRCRTKSERDAAKAEARQTVDRIQLMKPTTCPPNC